MSFKQSLQIAISGGNVRPIPLPSLLFLISKFEYFFSEVNSFISRFSIYEIFGLFSLISSMNLSIFPVLPCNINLTPALP